MRSFGLFEEVLVFRKDLGEGIVGRQVIAILLELFRTTQSMANKLEPILLTSAINAEYIICRGHNFVLNSAGDRVVQCWPVLRGGSNSGW